jgi:CheY-like chemotaxis protein
MAAHILIIDDDEDDRDLLSIAVHELDPKIHCAMARNGQEALDTLQTLKFPRPQLIFLDLNMSRMNGVQFIQEMKKDRVLQDIPVIVYTTSKLKEDAEKMLSLGASHVLTKPTSFKELCRNVRDIFEKEMIKL